MISPFRKANAIIDRLDDFFQIIDSGTLCFDEGIKHFLSGNIDGFHQKLDLGRSLERQADSLLKQIEYDLYKYSLLPELRSDVMRLIQRVDDIMDTMKEVLVQFDVERPHVPSVLHASLLQLSGYCMQAARESNKAASIFFRKSEDVRTHIDNAIDYERKADDLAENIKRKVFHELDELSLPEKFHLRYFTLHIESVSDIAKSIAYTLNLMLVKQFQ